MPLDDALSDNRCPSPVGRGLHDSFLKKLRIEKFVKLSWSDPTTRPPPQPPLSCIWSLGFSSNTYSKSTKPSSGRGLVRTSNASWLKYPNEANSRCVRMMSLRLKINKRVYLHLARKFETGFSRFNFSLWSKKHHLSLCCAQSHSPHKHKNSVTSTDKCS